MHQQKIAVWEVSTDDTPIYITTDGEGGHISIGVKSLYNHLDYWSESYGSFDIITNAYNFHIPSGSHLSGVVSDIFCIELSKPEFDFWTSMIGIDFGGVNQFVAGKFKENNVEWKKFYLAFSRFYTCLLKAKSELLSNVGESREIMHNAMPTLSEEAIRLYPKGEMQDTLVFCQRFPGLHFTSLLSSLYLPTGEPTQDPRLLRRLRENLAVNIEEITIPTLCEVVLLRDCPLLDVTKGYRTWLCISQLKALVRIYGGRAVELSDCWVFKDYIKLESSYFSDCENWLSVTYGFAVMQEIRNQSRNSWFSSYLLCEEKAFWLRLIDDVQNVFDVTISGYGAGALSFYCWNGELSQVCEFIRRRAAVLKHWDKEIELNILEIASGQYDSLNDEFSSDSGEVSHMRAGR